MGPFLFPHEFVEKRNPGRGVTWTKFGAMTTERVVHTVTFPPLSVLIMITEAEWLYLCHNISLQTLRYFNLIIVLAHRKTLTETLLVLSIVFILLGRMASVNFEPIASNSVTWDTRDHCPS